MCFSPQRRAICRHRNFKKWSEADVFCTFSLENVPLATAACNFSTSELQKMLWDPQLFCILTSKYTSRHSGVQFCRHLNFKNCSETLNFLAFWLQNILLATAACNFSTSELQKVLWDPQLFTILTSKRASRHSGVQFLISPLTTWLRTRRFNEPTFRLTRHTNQWKNTAFRDFSNIWRGWIFFLLTFALLHLRSFWLYFITLLFICFQLSILSEVYYLNFLRQSTTPHYSSTTKYYSSTTLYYKVLLQYYSVLHSTTKYYSALLQYYSVLQSATPVLLCTTKCYPVLLRSTKCYSSTTLYYQVLLQCYSVLQSTTPVLFGTTKYYSALLQYYFGTPVLLCTTKCYTVLLRSTKCYSSTTLYYKVLLQCYSVLQSTTPVLLGTTKYYSVLLQYYSVLQSTTPVLLCILQSNTHDWSLLHMKRHLQCAEQQVPPSNVTIILRLSRKMILMIDPCHIWNVIYNARSNRCHLPTSPNTVPVTKNDSHDWSLSHMKRHLQCAEHQRLPSNITKYCACHAKWHSKISQKFLQNKAETLFTIRDRSDHDPRMIQAWNRQSATRLATEVAFHARHEHFLLTNTTCRAQVTLQLHLILRLPRKLTLMIDPRHIWNVIYNARNNRGYPPTSPNAVPATKNDSHDWSSSHMKRPLQCAEQQASPSNLAKYCPCHVKWHAWLMLVTYETSFTMRGATELTLQHHQMLCLPRKMTLMIDPRHIWNVIYNARSNKGYPPTSPNTAPATNNDSPKFQRNFSKTGETSFTMRGRSKNETVRPQPALQPRLYFLRSPRTFSIEKCNISRSGYHSKFHQMLPLPRKVPVEIHQILRLPQKMTLMIDPRHIWNVIYNARNNRGYPPTSPNAVPATKNDSHDWSSSHMKRPLQCAEQQRLPSNITKYCTCHEKCLSKISKKFLENRWNGGADPRMKPSVRNPPGNRGYFSHSPRAFSIEKCNISRSGYHS